MNLKDIFKQRKFDIDPKIGIFVFCAIWSVLIYFSYREYVRYKSFLECSEVTHAIVIDKKTHRRRSKKGSSRRRSYKLEIQYSAGSTSIEKRKSILQRDFNKVNIGDTIKIEYACEYPKWVLYKELENKDLILKVPENWLKD